MTSSAHANSTHSDQGRSVVAVVGAGPRGVAVCERIAAASALDRFQGHLSVHVIDPYVNQGGSIWREDQTPVLLMNTTTCQTTLYPDASTQPRLGPGIGDAPTLAEFLAPQGYGETDFAPRREHGRYIAHVLREAQRLADPRHVEFILHAASVNDCTGEVEGSQTLRLDNGTKLECDLVIFALGHVPTFPSVRLCALEEFGQEHALPTAMPNNPVDVDYSRFDSAKVLAIEGMGLNFFDALGILTARWGGEFVEDTSGTLRYLPSGREPRLIVGSRSGQLYRAKPDLGDDMPEEFITTVLSRQRAQELSERIGSISYEQDLVPLIRRELSVALQSHGFADSASEEKVLAFLFPLGRRSVCVPDAHERTVSALRAMVSDSAYPPSPRWLLVYRVLSALREQINAIVASGSLTAESFFSQWLAYGQNSFAAWRSGPPLIRSRQLLALVDAGLVTFTGPGMHVTGEPKSGLFEVRAGSVEIGKADAFLAAHLPSVSLTAYTSELLGALYHRGDLRLARLESPGDEPGPVTGSIDVADVLYPVRESGAVDRRRIFLGVPVSTAQPGSAISAEPGSAPQLLILAERAVMECLDALGHMSAA